MPGSRCVVQGCNNVSNRKAGIGLHISPLVTLERSKWATWIRQHRKNFSPTGRFMVCSKHFKNDCFLRSSDSSSLRRQLIPGSVPCIWKPAEERNIEIKSARTLRQERKVSQQNKWISFSYKYVPLFGLWSQYFFLNLVLPLVSFIPMYFYVQHHKS